MFEWVRERSHTKELTVSWRDREIAFFVKLKVTKNGLACGRVSECAAVWVYSKERKKEIERERERESYCYRESKRLRSEEWMRKSCVEKGRYCVCERQGWDRVGVGVCDMFICAWSSALIKWTPFALFNAKCFLDVSNKSLAVLPRCGVSKSHWLTFVQDCLFASNISILWYNSH